MTENHHRFLWHLKQSDSAVWSVAHWLNERGYHVKINASGRAPNASEWDRYVDIGDLEVSQRVEVKHLSAEFTCSDDWPFAPDFIVCAKHSFDNAVPKPYAFFYLNKATTHFAIVRSESRKNWTVASRTDSRYQNGVRQDFYLCPLNLVRFVKFECGK